MKNDRVLETYRYASLIALFCVLLMGAHAQTVNLQLQGDYTIGNAIQTPASYAVGDVNNDGLPDMVALTKANSTALGPIAVFLNNGGGFAPAITITDNTGLSPNVVVIGDFNRDGNPDLALANDGISNGINIRLGNGTGNFATGTYLTAERGTFDLVTADFNGDGNLDLVGVGNSNDLRVFTGNGLGGFSAATLYTTSFGAGDIEVADYNVDGKPDIAVAASGLINIFLNNGAGVFTAAPNITGVGNPNRIVSADFNRDCIPDLAISSVSTGNTVKIVLGNGSGGFGMPLTIAVTNQPEYMAVGDFNRDKKVDIAVRRSGTTAGQANFTILPGDGAGGFGTAFELTLAAPANSITARVATIDADLDGKMDIVIGRQGGFYLYKGNSALFTKTENDFDGDLRSDLSVYRPSTGTWYVNATTRGFSTQKWGLAADKLTPADYDGDGKTDIAVWREAPGGQAAFYIFNSSTNTFRIDALGQTGDNSASVGDWDGDGKADPAVYRSAAIGSQSYFYFRGSSANPTNGITYVPWGTAGDVAARGDFDGDGTFDAAVYRPSSGVWYVRSSSTGQLSAQAFGLATDKIVPEDYDGDGKTDIAVLRPTTNTWYAYNSSSGSVSIRNWGISTDTLAPGDYNGDGRTDIAVYRGSEQSWYTPQCADFKMYGTRFGTSGDIPVASAYIP